MPEKKALEKIIQKAEVLGANAIVGIHKNTLWVRPKDMFLESVIIEGKEVERFCKVKN